MKIERLPAHPVPHGADAAARNASREGDILGPLQSRRGQSGAYEAQERVENHGESFATLRDELRSAVAGLVTAARLLQGPLPSARSAREASEAIDHEVERLRRIVDGMNEQGPPVKKILLVEDNENSREALADALQLAGYEVVAANNGLEALHRLRWGWRPTCIVLDMRLPLMNGWDFRNAVETDPKLRDIPIIGMTGAEWKPEDGNGFVARFSKPVDVEELLLAVQHCED